MMKFFSLHAVGLQTIFAFRIFLLHTDTMRAFSVWPSFNLIAYLGQHDCFYMGGSEKDTVRVPERLCCFSFFLRRAPATLDTNFSKLKSQMAAN